MTEEHVVPSDSVSLSIKSILEKTFFRISAKMKKTTNEITRTDNWKFEILFEKGFKYAFIIWEKGIV